MHDPVERASIVPVGPVRSWLLEQLVAALAAALTLVGPVWRATRGHASFVADQVRCRTAGEDPVDAHGRTVVRDVGGVRGVPRSLPAPPGHLEVLQGGAVDDVVRRLVAVGRPASLRREFGAWGRVPDAEVVAQVDEGRMRLAFQVLDEERVELVRRSS